MDERSGGMGADVPEAGDLRVFFAAERTMLAWIRTGVTLMGLGFVVARFGLFLRELAMARQVVEPPSTGFSVWVGAALLMVGVGANIVGALRFAAFSADFKRAAAPRPTRIGPELALAGLLALVGLILAVYLLLMR